MKATAIKGAATGLIGRARHAVQALLGSGTDRGIGELESPNYPPEEIYRALTIVYRRNWIVPIVFGLLLLWAVGYLLFGTIPITAKGNGMFLTPGAVVPFEATATGQIGKWYVKVGEHVKKGQLLAVLEQPLIAKQLEQAKQQLQDTIEKNRQIQRLSDTYTRLQKAAIEGKRKMLTARIGVLEGQVKRSKELAEKAHSEKAKYLAQKQHDLHLLRQLEVQRSKNLQEKLARTEQLWAERLRTDDELVQDKRALSDQQQRVADMQTQVTQESLKRVQAAESHLDTLNTVASRQESILDITAQIQELEGTETDIDKRNTEAKFQMQLEESELRRTIARYEKQLADDREIHSDYTGRILELTAGEGKLVTRGTRLGAIDTSTPESSLVGVAYFKVADGKRIKPGMTLRLTPATVERERYGSILATVTSVSPFPVTPEGVATVVGNSAVAKSLTKDEHQIEVFARLRRDPGSPTGYLWDRSEGPEIHVTSGTLATGLADIQLRPPLTFVVPILADWTGFHLFSDSGPPH